MRTMVRLGPMKRKEKKNNRHVLASLSLRAHMRRSVHVTRFPERVHVDVQRCQRIMRNAEQLSSSSTW